MPPRNRRLLAAALAAGVVANLLRQLVHAVAGVVARAARVVVGAAGVRARGAHVSAGAAVVLAAVLLAGCGKAYINYEGALGPRYEGGAATATVAGDTLRVVTFNIKYAIHIRRAVRLLREDPGLRGADVLFLQEMDEAGTRAIADSLGMEYVYYPSTLHPVTHRDFGNAILSRYPIEDDRKILLPHLQRLRRLERAAVGATLRIGERRVRVYCIHTGTFFGNGPRARREQLDAVLEDADRYPQVVLAGDFNSSSVPDVALAHGFSWPTRHLGRTSWFWGMDHVLLKGVALAGDSASAMGIVRKIHGASDHHPVWARVVLPATP